MVNLEYFTNSLPYNWHMSRVRHEVTHKIERQFNFDENVIKGAFGEMMVVAWLNAISDYDGVVFNNVLVPHSYSTTGDIELDIVSLSPYSVIVIEVKTLSGLLETHNDQWQQHLSKGSRYINNPTQQCFKQINAVKKLLQSHKIQLPLRGIVALANENEVRELDKQRLPIINSPIQLNEEIRKIYKNKSPQIEAFKKTIKLFQTLKRI